MPQPTLSIVVPTKDRAATCVPTVCAVLAHAREFELIVFDSSTDQSWHGQLPTDDRLRVVGARDDLNITQCFEQAVAHTTGDYVFVIGDDDGVTPALFESVDWARRDALESISSDPASYVMYNWPDVRSKYFGDAASGKVFLHLADVPVLARRDLAVERARFLRGAGQGCGVLPRVYHGLVARALLDRMRQRFGCCFAGVSPDVSFAYLASLEARGHALTRWPLSISGASRASNAGRSAMREHHGDLWSDPHMKHFHGEPWPEVVPEFFGVETVWAQACVAAIDLAGGEDRAGFGWARLYALLAIRHPDRWAPIRRSRRAAAELTSTPALAAALATEAAGEVAGLVGKVIRKARPAASVVVHPADSIVSASRIVEPMCLGASA